MIAWTNYQKNNLIGQIMDLATNVDNFRQVLILTMSQDGTMNVVERRVDDATSMEAIGMYRLMAADRERDSLSAWRDNDYPNRSSDEDDDG
jgi:hypothetical protein